MRENNKLIIINKKINKLQMYINKLLLNFFSINILMTDKVNSETGTPKVQNDNIVKDCKLSFLHHEYYRYSELIHNQTQHVERLYKENIITINTRNNCMRQLDVLLIFMNNDVYNGKFKQIKKGTNTTPVSTSTETDILDTMEPVEYSDEDIHKSDKSDKSEKKENNIDIEKIQINGDLDFGKSNSAKLRNNLDDKNIIDIFSHTNTIKNDRNIGILFDLCKNNKLYNLNEIIFDDFDKVKKKLLDICKEVGFYSIDDALHILIGSGHREYVNLVKHMEVSKEDKKETNEFKDKLELYNKVFIPIDYKIIPTTSPNAVIKSEMEWQMDKSNIGINTDIYIDSYGEVTIHLPNTQATYVFGGYFITDPLLCVIRTSQVCRRFIHDKIKQFRNIINADTNETINKVFANLYLKQMPLGDILSCNEQSFMKRIGSDYARYITITKMKSFKHQMDEFQKDNSLKNMYNMIRLLLMGPDECMHVAGMLFGLTKDKKFGAEIIAELIYRRLNYTLQTRLKKSSISLKNELEKLKAMSESDIDLKRQIAVNNNIPQHIKKIIFEKLEESKFQAGEMSKHKTVTDILIKYPWVDTDTVFENLRFNDLKCRKMIDNVYDVLKNKVYGHEECKTTIKELVCKMIMNPSSGGKAIGLVGPPGVGKTLIAKALGEALGIPSIVISLCGVEDPAVLNGHSFTYSAAQPGIIVKKMVEAGSARCVMFFDELDKSCQKHGVNEIQNVLINLTDPNMNTQFSDKFFDVNFPLNKVIFVFSYNDKSKIDPILLNRIHEISVDAYTVKDKLKICQDFLMKEILDGIGLKHNSITISDADIEYVCENYTHEPGVRELKRKIEGLFLKLNVDRIYRRGPFKCKCKEDAKLVACETCDRCKNDNKDECKALDMVCKEDCKIVFSPENPVKIDRDIVLKYLHKPKHDVEKIHTTSEVGIVNGLYATTTGGGGILKATCMKQYGFGKFNIKLTGELQNTIKESCEYAFTMACNLLKPEYVQKFIEETPAGIHVHFPSGNSKDGPSMGGLLTILYISRILNKRVLNTIAMTGTADINGNIGAIGGLPSKIRGAKAANVKHIYLPENNRKDYDEILKADPELFNDLKITVVSHVREVIPHVLLEDDGTLIDITKYLK